MTNTKLSDYFQVGHLYEYKMDRFSQIKDNGGLIIKKILLLKRIDEKSSSLFFDNIENGEGEVYYYEDYNMDTLKKIS